MPSSQSLSSEKYRVCDPDGVSYGVFSTREAATAFAATMHYNRDDLPDDYYCIKTETVLK